MTRLLVVGWPIVFSIGIVVVGRRHNRRRQKVEFARLAKGAEQRLGRQVAARRASEIRNERRRIRAEVIEQHHNEMQGMLAAALWVRDNELVAKFRRQIDALDTPDS